MAAAALQSPVRSLACLGKARPAHGNARGQRSWASRTLQPFNKPVRNLEGVRLATPCEKIPRLGRRLGPPGPEKLFQSRYFVFSVSGFVTEDDGARIRSVGALSSIFSQALALGRQRSRAGGWIHSPVPCPGKSPAWPCQNWFQSRVMVCLLAARARRAGDWATLAVQAGISNRMTSSPTLARELGYSGRASQSITPIKRHKGRTPGRAKTRAA